MKSSACEAAEYLARVRPAFARRTIRGEICLGALAIGLAAIGWIVLAAIAVAALEVL